jgi:hypothetical protein
MIANGATPARMPASTIREEAGAMAGMVTAVSRDAAHEFSKSNQPLVRLVEGEGVAGDAHFGRAVQHRSRVAQNPDQPNLRQVHLIHAELCRKPPADGSPILSDDLSKKMAGRKLTYRRRSVGIVPRMWVSSTKASCRRRVRFRA